MTFRTVAGFVVVLLVVVQERSCPAAAPSAKPATAPFSSTPVHLLDGSVMPGPGNTGVTNTGSLSPSRSIQVTTPGSVIQDLALTGSIEIKAANVTVKNCTIDAGGGSVGIHIARGADGCTIEDCSIFNTGASSYAVVTDANGNTFLRLNVYDTGDHALCFAGSSKMQGCWLHAIGWNAAGIEKNDAKPQFSGKAHVEDVFIERGDSLIFTGNNFQTPDFQTIDGVNYGTTTAVFFVDPYDAGDKVGSVTIENNYLDGGGYMFYLMGQGPVAISHNIIDVHTQYSLIYPTFIGCSWTWGGNQNPRGAKVWIPRLPKGRLANEAKSSSH